MKKWPKVSVVSTVYNTEQYIKKCIDSICEQTYENLQIIVVNDASKGNIAEIMEEYTRKDSRIKYVNLERNSGLFHARKKGAEYANGEYICFVDSDDYLGVDYIRSMVTAAMKEDADIVKTRFVLTDGNYEYVHGYIYNQPEVVLQGDEILREYFEQEGRDFSWHTVWNKLYKKALWDKCVPFYERVTNHLIMAEDFAYSTPLFSYAEKVVSISEDEYFYMQRAEASTGIVKDKLKYQKNIRDLQTAFDFVEDFLLESETRNAYMDKFNKWRDLYARFWFDNIERAGFSLKDKLELKNLLKETMKQEELKASTPEDNYFYSFSMEWNKRLLEAKSRISAPETKIVSFDIFDTLLQRPFFKPTDLFAVMEIEQKSEMPYKGYNFSGFRVKAEVEARRRSREEDVTLQEIYNVLQDTYDLPKENAERLMAAECEAELKYCYPRRCAKELYELALFMKKTVVIVSDMYLPEETVVRMLIKNGYTGYEKLYLSSAVMKTKASGRLFDMMQQEMRVEPEEIVHIGDNWEADIERTRERRYYNVFFPKAIEVFQNNLEFGGYPAGGSFGYVLNSWNAIHNNSCSLEFMGIRSMYAVIANEYFDNPYRCFHKDADFNSDPYYMGLYALGMHMYGIARDLIKIYGERRRIHFVSRDGFLCKKVYDIISKSHGSKAKSNYLYLSRKAILPTGYKAKSDFYGIEEGMSEKAILRQTPEKILQYFLNLKVTDELSEILRKRGIEAKKAFRNKQELQMFVSELWDLEVVQEHLYDYRTTAKKYFDDLDERDVLFDIGYNGTSQYLLSNLLDKKLDAYYVYLNKEKAMKYAKEKEYSVNTYYDSTPGVSGCIREFFFSECTPSCVGYEQKKDKALPVFEERDIEYSECKVAENIQRGTLKFVELLEKHFGKLMAEFYVRSYDCSIPFEYLMHKAKDLDRWAFHGCTFEDDVYYAESKNLYHIWNDAVSYYYAPVYIYENAEPAKSYGADEIYRDGVAIAIFRKMNRIAPFGSKRRAILRKVLGFLVGKKV